MGKFRSKNYIGEKASNWKGRNIKVLCDNCGEETIKPHEHLKNFKNHFCDKKCHDESASCR